MIDSVVLITTKQENERKVFLCLSTFHRLMRHMTFCSFMWLTYAGVALPVYTVVYPSMPLLLNEKNCFSQMWVFSHICSERRQEGR